MSAPTADPSTKPSAKTCGGAQTPCPPLAALLSDREMLRQLCMMGEQEINSCAIAYCTTLGENPDDLVPANPDQPSVTILFQGERKLESRWSVAARGLRHVVEQARHAEAMRGAIELVMWDKARREKTLPHLRELIL